MSNLSKPHRELRHSHREPTEPACGSLSGPLETSTLHKFLVAFNTPAGWPLWLVGGVTLIQIVAVSGLWWLLVGSAEAFYVGAVLAFFTLFDIFILASLPRQGVSFGPVSSQLLVLELPRLVLTVLAAGVAIWLGPMPALIGAVVIHLAAALALVRGGILEPQWLGLSQLTLADQALPLYAPSVRLLHISDLHVERFGRREEQLVQMVRAIAPDLILLTGDYLNLSCVDDPEAHTDARRVLMSLCSGGDKPAVGQVYAVLGSPPSDRNSASLFEGLPIRLLRDEAVTVDLGQGRRLALLGLDCSHDMKRDAERLATVAANASPDAFRVLLYHSPELMPVAPQFDINLYLCGHTHGGQVRLPFYGALVTSSKLGKRFEMGHYQVARTHLYVSRGVGMEGMGAPRVRFLCPPEVTLFSLDGGGAYPGCRIG